MNYDANLKNEKKLTEVGWKQGQTSDQRDHNSSPFEQGLAKNALEEQCCFSVD